jgi:hypothetical protein
VVRAIVVANDCPLAVWANLAPDDRKAQRKPVAELLFKQGFTQDQIATQLGVSQQMISKDLSGLLPGSKPPRPKGGRPKGSKPKSTSGPQPRNGRTDGPRCGLHAPSTVTPRLYISPSPQRAVNV